MINLSIYSISERQPKNNEEIVLFGLSYPFGMEAGDLSFDNVEYCWMELDENGEDTGSQISYDEKFPQPENTRLMLLTRNGHELSPTDCYALAEDIDKIFDLIGSKI